MEKRVAEYYKRTNAESKSLKYFFGEDSEWFDWKHLKKYKVIESWRIKSVTTEPQRCYICKMPFAMEKNKKGLCEQQYLPQFFFNIRMQSGRCSNC